MPNQQSVKDAPMSEAEAQALADTERAVAVEQAALSQNELEYLRARVVGLRAEVLRLGRERDALAARLDAAGL